MKDFLLYAKAACVSAAAIFVICWCFVGLWHALYSCIMALFTLLVIAAIVSAIVTLTFMFYDWKHRNEKSNPA